MGHKGKLLQTEKRDRFSVLPDGVAHHILSSLDFRDLTRVGAVSKTCRQFYLSIPSLDLDENYYSRTGELHDKMLNSWDRYLFHRGDNRVQQFRLQWNFCWNTSGEHLKIITWIEKAVASRVEVLDLSFSWPLTMFKIPSCVFHSQSLRSLSVYFEGWIFQVPSVSVLPNLQHLKLYEVRIEDECFFKWISCSCKCIKELQLLEISGIQTSTSTAHLWNHLQFVQMICLISTYVVRSLEIYILHGEMFLRHQAANL